MENQIGRKIARRLREIGKTQVWLAEKAGVSNNAVTKWIKSGQVSIDNARRVAPALGITLTELLDDDVPVSQSAQNSPMPQQPERKTMNHLADRIKTIIREMPGPDYGKRAKLAKIANCDKPVVTHWLKGQEKINAQHAAAICDALGYRLEWLLRGEGPRRPGETEEEPQHGEKLYLVHVSNTEMEILDAYRKADEMGRNLIDHLCKTVERAAASETDKVAR